MLGRIERQLSSRTGNNLDERILHSVTGPLVVAVFLQGVFLAAVTFDILAPRLAVIHAVWSATVVGLLAITGGHAFSAFLLWYSERGTASRKAGLDGRLLNRFRKLTVASLYILAGMIILDRMGIPVSPLLAGLGIGGLAVSLALQPTLSNLFAGTYLVSDKVANPGDYVELESGVAGYVMDVGWRSTRIRTLYNNLVVIPNSRMADSIVTNFHNPSMEVGVLVMAGVSYTSDLSQVRRVSLEVAREVVQELPEASKGFEPWFGFEAFGEYNVTFWLWVEAKDRISQYNLKSTIIERLRQRLRQEGIEINYPLSMEAMSADGRPVLRPSAEPSAQLGPG
jgi:small-conductance mechanosensitive channel